MFKKFERATVKHRGRPTMNDILFADASNALKDADLKIKWATLNIEDIRHDESFQRPQNDKHLAMLYDNFVDVLLEIVYVIECPNKKYLCVDGGHSIVVAKARGLTKLRCAIIYGKKVTTGEAAAAFVAKNCGRRALSHLDVFWAALKQKHPLACKVQSILNEFGCSVPHYADQSGAHAKCPSVLMTILHAGGEDELRGVIRIICAIWDEHESRRFANGILKGIWTVLYHREAGTRPIDTGRLIRVLRGVAIERVFGLADQKRVGMRLNQSQGFQAAIEDLYFRRCSKKMKGVNSEDK